LVVLSHPVPISLRENHTHERLHGRLHGRGHTELPAIASAQPVQRGYEITIEMPEFTSICPKTKLPDFGKVTIHYLPDKVCLELKALKYYILGYRNLGIFYENAINRILLDIVAACNPVWAVVRGEFTVRGGMKSTIEARHPAKR
jgi:7-cyano-7-deazaguanine reductase